MATAKAGLRRRIIVGAELELRRVRTKDFSPRRKERGADRDLRTVQKVPASDLACHLLTPNALSLLMDTPILAKSR